MPPSLPHNSILSQNGVSGNPGAVHPCEIKELEPALEACYNKAKE
jgi:hypothetical protein